MKQAARGIVGDSWGRRARIACSLLLMLLGNTPSEAGSGEPGQDPTPKEGSKRQGQTMCIGSDFIVDFLQNKPESVETLRTGDGDLFTTEVNRFQVFLSLLDRTVVSQRELAAARAFFSKTRVMSFRDGDGETAARIAAALKRAGEGIDESDCFIAAIMAREGCSRILTRDEKKHFTRIPGISADEYWTPGRLRGAKPLEPPRPKERTPSGEESARKGSSKQTQDGYGRAGSGVRSEPLEKSNDGEKYWTPDRLRGARPVDLPHPREPLPSTERPARQPGAQEQEGGEGSAGRGESTGEAGQGQTMCIGTDFIVDFLRGRPEAVEAVRTGDGSLFTTEVNRFQVFLSLLDRAVVNQQELAAARAFFSETKVLPFGDGSGEAAAKLVAGLRREGQDVDEADCLIAAIMARHGCSRILTRDQKKHFGRIPGVSADEYWTPGRLRRAKPLELPGLKQPIGSGPLEKSKDGVPEKGGEY